MVNQKGSFISSLLLADIKGLNVLDSDEHLAIFVEEFYPRLSAIINGHGPLAASPWGDALFCAFADPIAAAHCALDVRDLFKAFDWNGAKMPALQIRISLHAGKAYQNAGSTCLHQGLICSQLHFPALLEPALRSGEVWTSNPFLEQLRTAVPQDIIADNLGSKHLAHKWGGTEIHRLRRPNDLPLDDHNIFDKSASKHVDPVAILLTLFERGDAEQQHNAVRMLGRKEDIRALEKLCAIASDSNLSLLLRLDAVASLGEMKSSGALPTISAILDINGKEDPRLQIAGIKALTAIGDSQDDKVLLKILKHLEAYQKAVIKKALHALIFLGNQTTYDYVTELVQQNKLRDQLLKAALRLLTVVEDIRVSTKAAELLDPEIPHDIRQCALTYLVYGNPHSVCDRLYRIVRDMDESHDLRVVALTGLTRIDSNETRSFLAEIAEAAEPLSSYAAQFLVEGKEMAEKLARETREELRKDSW